MTELPGFATQCACGASVVWVETNNKKRMPLDVEFTMRIVFDKGVATVMPVFTTHFATCPNRKTK